MQLKKDEIQMNFIKLWTSKEFCDIVRAGVVEFYVSDDIWVFGTNNKFN